MKQNGRVLRGAPILVGESPPRCNYRRLRRRKSRSPPASRRGRGWERLRYSGNRRRLRRRGMGRGPFGAIDEAIVVGVDPVKPRIVERHPFAQRQLAVLIGIGEREDALRVQSVQIAQHAARRLQFLQRHGAIVLHVDHLEQRLRRPRIFGGRDPAIVVGVERGEIGQRVDRGRHRRHRWGGGSHNRRGGARILFLGSRFLVLAPGQRDQPRQQRDPGNGASHRRGSSGSAGQGRPDRGGQTGGMDGAHPSGRV